MTVITRVLMTSDSIGGVWNYALELAGSLGKQGIEVVLVNMGRRCTPAQHREAWSVPAMTLFEEPLKLEWMDDPWNDVDRAGELLLALENRFSPDVVHLNGYAYGVLPFHAPKIVVAHSCVLSWWEAVHRTPPPGRYDEYRTRVARGLDAADAVVCVSGAMREALQRNYGTTGRSCVIYNGGDPSLFGPDEKETFVFAAGRFWDEAKGLRTLAEASPQIAWPIVAAGDDQRPPGIGDPQIPRELRSMKMLGPLPRSQIASWLGRASIYAHPARYEPFGLTVLEAALSACALVLGDIASFRELWDDAAIFVPPGDASLLAAVINQLIEDPSRRAALADRAYQRALSLDVEDTTAGYLSLYQTLLSEKRTPGELAHEQRG